MNWAIEHEAPEEQKVSHFHVNYMHPSPEVDERCGNCRNFIKPEGARPRCRTVREPIRAEDYCDRYVKEKK